LSTGLVGMTGLGEGSGCDESTGSVRERSKTVGSPRGDKNEYASSDRACMLEWHKRGGTPFPADFNLGSRY
jgi:hypothetical protein